MTEAEEISTAAATLRRTLTLPADAAEPLAHLLATEAQWAERCGNSYTKGTDSAAASARDVVAIARAVNSERESEALLTERYITISVRVPDHFDREDAEQVALAAQEWVNENYADEFDDKGDETEESDR